MARTATDALPKDATPLQVKLLGLTRHADTALRLRATNVIDLNNIAKSRAMMALAVSPLVTKYSLAAATLAARDYESQRKEYAAGTYRAWLPEAPPKEQIAATTGWAMSRFNKLDDPDLDPEDIDLEELADSAVDDLAGGLSRIILNGARNTTIGNTQRDPVSIGWARSTSSGACSFCLMLAARGFVYKTNATANFRAHDHCACQPVAGFKGQTRLQNATSMAANSLWSETYTSGMSESAAHKAFRDAVAIARTEGRWESMVAAEQELLDSMDS